MSLDEIRAVLEPVHEKELPFAAAKQRHPARRHAPLVPHLYIRYRQWDGPKLAWSEDFGKGRGQVYSRDGSEPVRSCNEVEVAKRLRTIRQNATWISSYSPSQVPLLWRPWTAGPAEAPAWLRQIDGEIRRLTGAASGGIPDVVAWDDSSSLSSAILIECKGEKESFKEGQEDWVAAAIACGLTRDQIVVAVRTFA